MSNLSEMANDELGPRVSDVRSKCYRGSARVPIQNLIFSNGCRELSQSNVHRLVDIFYTQDCLRCDWENRINVVISKSELAIVLEASHLTSKELLIHRDDDEPPLLIVPDGIQFTCLEGRHRIEAARRFLFDDAWWTVNIHDECETKRPWIFQYTDKLTALSREVQTQMEEMFLNENAYSDGQILRKIRYYR